MSATKTRTRKARLRKAVAAERPAFRVTGSIVKDGKRIARVTCACGWACAVPWDRPQRAGGAS